MASTATDGLTTWAADDPEPVDVTTVRDNDGDQWTRDPYDEMWVCVLGDGTPPIRMRWQGLATEYGPLTSHRCVAVDLRARAADPAVVAAVAGKLVGLLDRGVAEKQAAHIIGVVLDELVDHIGQVLA